MLTIHAIEETGYNVTIHGLPDSLPVKNHGEGLLLAMHKPCFAKGEDQKFAWNKPWSGIGEGGPVATLVRPFSPTEEYRYEDLDPSLFRVPNQNPRLEHLQLARALRKKRVKNFFLAT